MVPFTPVRTIEVEDERFMRRTSALPVSATMRSLPLPAPDPQSVPSSKTTPRGELKERFAVSDATAPTPA